MVNPCFLFDWALCQGQNIDFQHDVGPTPLMTHFQATINNASFDHDGQANIYYAPELISGLAKYIYIYAFSRRFYPKRLTMHSGYTFFLISMCVPWESNP